MLHYQPPVRDLNFVLNDVLELGHRLPECLLSKEDVTSILENAGRFARDQLAPLNSVGDAEGCRIHDGNVTTPSGFPQAYQRYVDGGWASLTLPVDIGGQGLPNCVGAAVNEIFHAANLSFTDYLGTAEAARLIAKFAAPEVQKRCLSAVVNGTWTVTQCMTEPQAGSDLGLIKASASPEGDAFRISGRKIFISGGDQDLTANILHLVLARLPDAPPGSRGLSLFLVSKFQLESDGRLGARNSVAATRLEHKMGYGGSATCEMMFDNAYGWLLGAPHGGLAAMFELVGPVRLFVGQQGVAQAELAYQNAVSYAVARRQGRASPGAKRTPGSADPIIQHADVRRSLASVRAFIEASRTLILYAAFLMDLRQRATDEEAADLDARIALLTPLIKAACSDGGFESANACMDIFGGHGYIKDLGMEQIVRDVRIAQIHEGSNGINAYDFLARAVPARNASAFHWFIDSASEAAAALSSIPTLESSAAALQCAVEQLHEITAPLIQRVIQDRGEAAFICVDYLKLFASAALGWCVAISAVAAAKSGRNDDFNVSKIALARFYLLKLLPLADGRASSIKAGSAPLAAIPSSFFEPTI